MSFPWINVRKINRLVAVHKRGPIYDSVLDKGSTKETERSVNVVEKRVGDFTIVNGHGRSDRCVLTGKRSLQTRSQRHRPTRGGSWRAGCGSFHGSRHSGCPPRASATPRPLQINCGLRWTVRASRESPPLAGAWSQGKENTSGMAESKVILAITSLANIEEIYFSNRRLSENPSFSKDVRFRIAISLSFNDEDNLISFRLEL